MTRQPSVAILYGFAEGAWHSRKLRRLLKDAGFSLTNSVHDADILIAHSGGCYLIPPDATAQLVLHIGYTYWPGRPLYTSLRKSLSYDLKQHGLLEWLARCTMHSLHMLIVVHTARMVPGWRAPARVLEALPDTQHIFVRNQHDSYCNPNALLQGKNPNHVLVSLPGGHLDIWDNPRYYVNLLQSVYG